MEWPRFVTDMCLWNDPRNYYIRDVKSSRQTGLEANILASASVYRPQSFGLGLGLKHLASAWPRSAAEEPAANKRLASLFADYRYDTIIHVEGSYWSRENEKLNCVVLIIMI